MHGKGEEMMPKASPRVQRFWAVSTPRAWSIVDRLARASCSWAVSAAWWTSRSAMGTVKASSSTNCWGPFGSAVVEQRLTGAVAVEDQLLPRLDLGPDRPGRPPAVRAQVDPVERGVVVRGLDAGSVRGVELDLVGLPGLQVAR